MLEIHSNDIWVTTNSSSNQPAFQKTTKKSKRTAAVKPTVLVVDDERTIADTTAEILNRFGFQAIRAYDGQQALKIAAKLQPDYLLTDVLMPGMNGVELAIAITRILPLTKTLIFSGQAGVSDLLQQAEEQGYVFNLVDKPIHPEKLIDFLRGM